MRFTTIPRMIAFFVVGALTALSAPAQQTSSDQQTGDSVADAARKVRADQKTAPKPKKVYTDDDFNSSKTAPATASAKTGGQSADQAAGDKAGADNDPKSEANWRKRFSTVREKLASAEKELDVLQRELEKNQVQYYNDPQKALTEQYDRKDISDNAAKINAKKKQIDDLKQQLSDMEDELRKVGGDSGWAR